MKKIFTSLLLLLAVTSVNVLAQSTEESTNEKIGETLKSAESAKTTNDGLNSLNIPVDGLVGPDEKDLGWSMLQYMLGSVSVEVYDKLFNKSTNNATAEGVVTGTTLLLAIMSGIGLMMLYTVMFYVVLFGLLFSNVSGKPFGERWSTPHLAIRSFLSLTLLQPMARYSGLNGGQVIILGLALVSMGFAGAIFRQINSTMLTTPIVNNSIKDLDTLFLQLAQSHMCQASLAQGGIVKTDEFDVEVESSNWRGAFNWISQAMWEAPDDISLDKVTKYSYCVGPECVCGNFVVSIPVINTAAITAEDWERIQVRDFFGDWITQYMHIEGAIKINQLISNYLDSDNSRFNESSKVIFDFINNPEKSKNVDDIGSAAKELQVAYRAALDKNWLDFKAAGYSFLDEERLSTQQIATINNKMADILSDTGFVTAGFAHYIWMQRQEKLASVFNTVVSKSMEVKKPPLYENDEYLDILDVDDSISEQISYPIILQSKMIQNLSYQGLLPTDFNQMLMQAAKGETEDSYTGAVLNEISTFVQGVLFNAARLGGSGLTEDTPDPVMEMKFMGDTIFSVLVYGGLAAKFTPAGKLVKGLKGLAKNDDDDKSGFLGLITAALFTALLTLAFTYSFVIPSIPFVMFTLGVAAYFAYLFAVLGGSTVWIATWALPDGHDVFGHGGSGWSMVATLMLKPTFMLIGLVLGSVIIKTMGFYVNSTFLPSMLALNSGVNPVHIIGNMTIYATLMSVLVYKSYSLIFEFGELIFAMIGVNGQHASFFKASEGSQALTGLNTVAASKLGGHAKDAVGAMLKMKSQQNKTTS
jgi:conjugal transfer/type IV secretion protein DotA/TraY